MGKEAREAREVRLPGRNRNWKGAFSWLGLLTGVALSTVFEFYLHSKERYTSFKHIAGTRMLYRRGRAQQRQLKELERRMRSTNLSEIVFSRATITLLGIRKAD